MHFASRLVIAFTFLVAVGCGGTSSESGGTTPTSQRGSALADDDLDGHVDLGLELSQAGRCDDALRRGFEPALAIFASAFGDQRVIAQRDDPMLLVMERMNQSGNQFGMVMMREGPDGTTRRVIGDYYPDVLYMTAYCYIDIGNLAKGEEYLRRALDVIPEDALYLNELGHVAQTNRDFTAALGLFERAVASARELETRSPSATIIGTPIRTIRHRAMRGVGFSLIELGRLDEADATYAAILAENPGDEQAANERQVIAERRVQGRQRQL